MSQPTINPFADEERDAIRVAIEDLQGGCCWKCDIPLSAPGAPGYAAFLIKRPLRSAFHAVICWSCRDVFFPSDDHAQWQHPDEREHRERLARRFTS